MSGREAQGSLLFHGQRKPTQSSGRLGVLFSGSAPTAFCRDDSCGPRTDRNAKDLDHHKTERLSRFFLMWAKRSSSSGTARTKRAVRVLSKRSEEHTSELQSLTNLVCRLLLEKKKKKIK